MRMKNLKYSYMIWGCKDVLWLCREGKCGVLKLKKLFWYNIGKWCMFLGSFWRRILRKENQDRLAILPNYKRRKLYLGTLAVRAGLPQVSLSPGILGGWHHLHRLGDLLDVLDGFETHRNGLEGGHTPGLLVPTTTDRHINPSQVILFIR